MICCYFIVFLCVIWRSLDVVRVLNRSVHSFWHLFFASNINDMSANFYKHCSGNCALALNAMTLGSDHQHHQHHHHHHPPHPHSHHHYDCWLSLTTSSHQQLKHHKALELGGQEAQDFRSRWHSAKTKTTDFCGPWSVKEIPIPFEHLWCLIWWKCPEISRYQMPGSRQKINR